MKKSNIVLTGMPGAGKSTLGVVLAKALGKQFIDTDLLIQQHTGECLQDTIHNKGINGFLSIEEEIVSALECENSIIATGGSVVLSAKAMDNLRRTSIIIYLDVPLEEIKKRITNITTRGIAMQKGESIDSIYEKRLPFYKEYADITVNAENAEFEKTVEKIIKKVIN